MTAVAPIRPSPTRISCSAICRPICSTARSPSTPKPPARDRRASADRAGYRQGRRPDLRSRQAHRRPGDLDATRRYHPAAAGPYRRGPPFRQLGRPRSIAPWSPRARRTENRLDKGRLPRPRVTAGATAKTAAGKPRTTSGRGSSGHCPERPPDRGRRADAAPRSDRLPEPGPENRAAISIRSARPPIITVIGGLAAPDRQRHWLSVAAGSIAHRPGVSR
jgi:hypothetical protein